MSAMLPNSHATPFHKLLEQLRQEHEREVAELKRRSMGEGHLSESEPTLGNGSQARMEDVSRGLGSRSAIRKGTPATGTFNLLAMAKLNDDEDDEDDEEIEHAPPKCRPGTPPRRKASPPPCPSTVADGDIKTSSHRSAWEEEAVEKSEEIAGYLGTASVEKASPSPSSISDDLGPTLSPIIPVEKPQAPCTPELVLAPAPQGPSPVILRMQAMTRAAIRAKHDGMLENVDEDTLLPGTADDNHRPVSLVRLSAGSRTSRSCLKKQIIGDGSEKLGRAGLKRSVSFDSVMDGSHMNTKQRNENFKLKKGWQVEVAEAKDKPPQKTESFRVSVMQERRQKRSTKSEIDESMQISDPCIADPNALQNFTWELSGTFLVLLDYFFIPLQVFKSDMKTLVKVLAALESVFWTLDVVRTFLVGYHDKGILVMSAKHIRIHYLRTWALFDGVLLSCNWTLLIILSASGSSRILGPLQAFGLLRGIKIYRVLKSVEERIESQHISIIFKIVKLLSSIVLMCHLIACAWFAIGDTASSTSHSWLEEYGMKDRSTSYTYTSSFHWALTQFTPASIAIQPTNVWERSFAVVTLLCALIMFSLFVSGITDALLDLRTLGNFKAKQFWLLRKYLSECNVPKEVSLRVQVYCSYAYENRMRYVQENTVNLLEMLSTPLRAELRTAIFEPRMAQHPFFVLMNKVAPLTMQLLCTDAVARVMLAHGDLLFQSGQCASQMYFVTAGTLSYEAPTVDDSEADHSDSIASFRSDASFVATNHDTRLTEGSWVSEAVLWVEWTYVGNLSAYTECDLVSLDAEKFRHAVHSNVNTRAEATLYAKGFVLGLNRIDKAKVTDLFQSGLLEGLWFRLLNEYNVKRRGRGNLQSNSMLFNTTVASAIARMFSKSQCDNDPC